MQSYPQKGTALQPPTRAKPDSDLLGQIPPAILKAQIAFWRDRPQLLREHLGQWVVYHQDKAIIFTKTALEAYRECERRGTDENEYVVYGIDEGCDLEPLDPGTLDQI
jgi:hypothetical protein